MTNRKQVVFAVVLTVALRQDAGASMIESSPKKSIGCSVATCPMPAIVTKT